ncbi:hypothetical protein FHETE_9355 [Fusarium heterosporum]|uniref:Uncharacterized protein n=1 Tax=Fusarium heterosporum TaxID=42747 RepID=A0A8H5SYR5_FUSHE|nr:hypothetical protein FHETE_9355 [Fusarium heterosporum]
MSSQPADDVTATATTSGHENGTGSWPLNLEMAAKDRKLRLVNRIHEASCAFLNQLTTLVENGKKREKFTLQELKQYLKDLADPHDPTTLTLSKLRAANVHFLGPVVQKPRAKKQEAVDSDSEDGPEDDEEAEAQAMAFDNMKIASYFMTEMNKTPHAMSCHAAAFRNCLQASYSAVSSAPGGG